MTQRLKIILISILGALMTICAGLLMLVNTAKAESITMTGLSDDLVSFEPGASVPLALSYDSNVDDLATMKTGLKFNFCLDDYNFEDLSTQVPYASTWWGALGYNLFLYEFTLYRADSGGDGVGNYVDADKVYSVLVAIFCNKNKTFYGFTAERDFYRGGKLAATDNNSRKFLNGTRLISVTDTENDMYHKYEGIATDGKTFEINSGSYNNTSQTFGGGYSNIKYYRLSNNNLDFNHLNGLSLHLLASVNSPFSYYFIRSRYCFDTISYAGMFSTDQKIIYGDIYSSSRSTANVLSRMQSADPDLFVNYFGTAEQNGLAYQILAVDATQRVRIKYLTPIPGTPYATHNYTYVDVPVLQNTIYLDDVETALDLDLSKCLDSNAYCFRKTTDDDGEVYQLYYLKNVWLRTATVDGHYFDYFLDINDSYKDIYYPYVSAEILNEDIYEWIFSTQMINKFPALSNYRFNEIYGYFGLVVVPETYTLNSALKTMFDISTSKIGVISNFTFERMLSYSGYQSLLEDYQYGFLSRVWSEVAGFTSGTEHQATYYVIYSEPGTENALIGEGGQTDIENPGSIAENEILEPTGEIIANVWDGITGFLTGFTGATQTILWIALGVVAVIVIIIIYKKIKK